MECGEGGVWRRSVVKWRGKYKVGIEVVDCWKAGGGRGGGWGAREVVR